MKTQLLILPLLLPTCIIFAQSYVSKGELQINAGIGLSSWGVPVYFGFDRGITY